MKTDLETLLQAINLASYEGAYGVDVDMKDLLLLRAVIIDQQKALKKAEKEIHILSAKVVLKDIDRPVKLKAYIQMQDF